MKKWTLLVVLATVALALNACSGSTTDNPPKESSSSAGAPELPALPIPKPEPAPVKMVTVPAGTELNVVLTAALNSGTNKAGDTFTANLAAPLMIGGKTVLEKGAMLHGSVLDAKESGRVKGLASLTLSLTGVMHDGKTTNIVTKSLFQEAENSKKRDAEIIGGVAAGGAAIGALLGGKKGAAEGAGVGAGAGTGAVLATKGKEVELAPETKLTFTVDKSFEVAEAGK